MCESERAPEPSVRLRHTYKLTLTAVTFLSFAIILASITIEFIDYRRVTLEPSIIVDRSRGEKLEIDLDITFPRVPCFLLSLDVMDISGERQNDIKHDMAKHRLSRDGQELEVTRSGQLKGEAERAAQNRDPNYCGSCYGAQAPESGCCNSCDEVRKAYSESGWQFPDPATIEQCVEENWAENMARQNTEGCRMEGQVKVNKVVGNLQFTHGNIFTRGHTDLLPYLRDGSVHHDFGHIINKFRFTGEMPGLAYHRNLIQKKEEETRQELGIRDPLQGVRAHADEVDTNMMYQYFVKVVSTAFVYLNGQSIQTNQYSASEYERDLSHGNRPTKDEHGHLTSHHTNAIPGVFINYEISPMKVVHTETRQSFAHFVTSTCAIVGGVLTVASLIDAAIFNSRKRLMGEKESYGALSGKMM